MDKRYLRTSNHCMFDVPKIKQKMNRARWFSYRLNNPEQVDGFRERLKNIDFRKILSLQYFSQFNLPLLLYLARA